MVAVLRNAKPPDALGQAVAPEDLRPLILVEAQDVLRRHTQTQAKSDDASRGGARYKVEVVGDLVLDGVLNCRQERRREEVLAEQQLPVSNRVFRIMRLAR